MTVPATRQPRSLFPELSEFFTSFPSMFPSMFPSFAGLRPMLDSRLMRLEDEVTDGRYELRAEIPGVDPAKDIDITVCDGQLTIKAERSEKKDFDGRSEFSYGSFVRTVPLPAGAGEDDIKATYDNGILSVSIPMSQSAPAEKHVAIAPAEQAKQAKQNK